MKRTPSTVATSAIRCGSGTNARRPSRTASGPTPWPPRHSHDTHQMSPSSTCPPRTLELWISWWLVPASWLSPATWSCWRLPRHPSTCSPAMAPVATPSPRRCTATRADLTGLRHREHDASGRLARSALGVEGCASRIVRMASANAVVGAVRVPSDDLLPVAERHRDAGCHRTGDGVVRLQRDVLQGHELFLHRVCQTAAVRRHRCTLRLRGHPRPVDHLEANRSANAGLGPLPAGVGLRARAWRLDQRQPQLDPDSGSAGAAF